MNKTTKDQKTNSGLHSLPEQLAKQKNTEKTILLNGSIIQMTLSASGWVNHIKR